MRRQVLPFAVCLSFNGNCRQAFDFYQCCFGGKLEVQTLADTPHGIGMNQQMRKAVLYATLNNDYLKLVGTDLTDKGNIVQGNNVSILIECNSLLERTELINKLAEKDARSTDHPSPIINVVDKFSINWIFTLI